MELLANIGENAGGGGGGARADASRPLDSVFSAADESALAVLGSRVLGAVTVLVSTFAHVSPTFAFSSCEVHNYFGPRKELLRTLAVGLFQQGVAQGYKLFGSMEVLGDPLSLASKVGEGMVQFLRVTGAELTGESDFKGEGIKRLAQGVVGGAAQSASKISGTLEEMVSGVAGNITGQQVQHSALRGALDADGGAGAAPRHLGEGVVQGGSVMLNSLHRGVTGLYRRPMQAIENDEGVAGFVSGVGKGIVGFLVSPVAGALGAFRTVTASVDATLHLWDARPLGRRRPPRRVGLLAGPLRVLTDDDWLRNLPRDYVDIEDDGAEDGDGDGDGDGLVDGPGREHAINALEQFEEEKSGDFTGDGFDLAMLAAEDEEDAADADDAADAEPPAAGEEAARAEKRTLKEDVRLQLCT